MNDPIDSVMALLGVFGLCLVIIGICGLLFGCGDKDRFVERVCLDQNGNSVECVR